jgi:hypothetical protein
MIISSRPLRVALTGVAIGAVLLTAACGGSKHKSTPSTSAAPPSTPAPTSPAASTTPPPKPVALNPYTGIGAVPTTPVIAVKIDDTAPGRPQVGIDKADIVYVEAVEGGLTRLAAVFGTNKPVVGYVRSTRPSDPDLLLQFGKITEAYSGGAHDSLPRVKASGITSWSNDAGAPYYSRVSRAASSYINLELNLAKVAKKTKSNAPRSIGWTFSPSLTGLTTSTGTDVRTVVTGSNPGGTAVEFRYNAKLKKYVRYIGGVEQFAADGQPVAMTNVIVQSCKVVAHPADTDVNGNPSQFTYTVGTGTVAVFRQGKRINGTWSRAALADGTTLKTSTGQPLPLDPGNTWVVLIRKGIAVHG